ncbi:hypothetical protein F5Y10DRAFT_240842 [Nemania abortiva]|nr:hypothetical protein F5Y10DRAFT_240842 [Nemania abortiva]
MDPSSFASAAASLLGVTIQITGSLYGNWEYSSLVLAERLIYELSQLRNVLQSLEVTALSVADAISPPPQDLLVCLEDVKTCLISLGSKLLREDPHTVFSFQDSLPPWRSFNAPMPSQYSRLPLSPAEATNDIQSLQACFSRLENSIAKSAFASTEGPLPKRIADPTGALWKDRAEYFEFHESACKSRLDGTGRWFVVSSKFRSWFAAERAPKNTLFCCGAPGSGKTILTSLAIDFVQRWQKDNKSRNVGLAYFYFSYKTPSPLRNVALALLEQLNLQSPFPDEEVAKLEVLADKGGHIPFPDIVSAVIAVSKRFRRAYIILDALDECPLDYQKDLLYILTSIKNSPARLFASSRPHQIFDIFTHSPTIYVIPSKKDIILYARSRLQALPVHYDHLRHTIIDALLKTGERYRMFLPIVLQLNAILTKATAQGIMQELVKSPTSLHTVYQDRLKRIRNQDPLMVEIAGRTLAWLCYSQRPLETSELIEVHRYAISGLEIDAQLVVRSCMGLVQSEPKISFAHFSVKEFLEENHVCDEKEVALLSLSYLSNWAVGRVTSPEIVHSLIQSNRLLNYAASYWGRHIRNYVRKSNIWPTPLKPLCLTLLREELKVAVLCHIVFTSSPPQNRAINHGLVKSSSLHLAAYFGLDWLIDSLIGPLGTTVDRDEWDRTPLHIAAENGFEECVRDLLTLSHLSPNQKDSDGRTAWHYVAMSGNLEALRHLLVWHSKSRQIDPLTGLGADNMGKGISPLEYAAAHGDIKLFREFLLLYEDVSHDDVVKSFISNAMLAAIAGGKIKLVEYILSKGQIPYYEHLLVATKAGLDDIAQLLVDYGVEAQNPTEGGESAIVIAAREGRNKILELLIWNGVLLDGSSREARIALSSAVKTGNAEGVRTLLFAGADPNGSVDGSEKPIAYAARHGMTEIVQMLLEAHAEATQAVFAAVETGHIQILQLLLNSGVPANLKSRAGQSLVEMARETDNAAAVELLRSYGLDISTPAVYSVLTDDDVDMQTPPEQHTPSDTDAAFPGGSSQTLNTKQTGTILAPEPSREIAAGTETKEQSEWKYIRPKEEPDDEVMESAPFFSSPWSFDLPFTEQGVSRSPASSGNPAPFLILSEPINVGSIDLGSVVITPRNPLSGYTPEDLTWLSQTIRNLRFSFVQCDFTSTSQRKSMSSFALELLRPILNRNSTPPRLEQLNPSCVYRERLHNHEEALQRIFQNRQMRSDIWEMVRGLDGNGERKELFLVVGLLKVTSLISQKPAESGSAASVSAFKANHEGDKIFAISYRSLKAQTRPLFSNQRGSASVEDGVSLDDYFSPKPYERLL